MRLKYVTIGCFLVTDIMELRHYLSIYLFIYLNGKKWPIGTAFFRADHCSEKPLKNLRLPVPSLLPSYFIEGLPAACIILPNLRCCHVFFPPEAKFIPWGLVSWIGLCHGGPPPSSRSFQSLSQSQLTCLLLKPRAHRFPLCRPRALFTLGLGCFSAKICLAGCAASGQHLLRDEMRGSETDPEISLTHSPASPR